MKKTLGMVIVCLIGLGACQSTPTAPVMQRTDATFETTGLGASKTAAQQDALTAAKKQCNLRNPIVLTDEVKYNGVLDEKTGRALEQGMSVIGSILGKKTSLSRPDDYEYTISFKCQ